MSKENSKDFNLMMHNSKDMPKIVFLKGDAIKKWGGEKMIIAPPLFYDKVMKQVPSGKIITINEIRKYIACKNNADITCPLTAGIFINICAWASFQRTENITPYWRILKSNGELNPKYPGGVSNQKKKLEEEGHKIIKKGTKNIKYYVDNYEKSLYNLK